MSKPDVRERVLNAAMAAIAERGLSRLRMEDIGERAGMSKGHILYYYRSKEQLLLETLRWSEERLAVERARELSHLSAATDRLRRFIELYLPDSPGEPSWLLWAQVWALGTEREDARAAALELNGLWAADLIDIVELGRRQGVFAAVDPCRSAEELLAILDGFSLHLLQEAPLMDRPSMVSTVLAIANDHLLQRRL